MLKELTNDEYHKEADHISCSGIKRMLISPWHFKNPPVFSTDSLAFGSMLHTLTLEPELFKDEFAVAQKFDKRTKKGKAEFAEFESENKGKIIVSAQDFEQAHRMSDAARATGFFNHGDAELSIFNTLYKSPVKIRPDFLSADRKTYYELKSAQDASPRLFGYAFNDYRYDIQDALYRAILTKEFPEFERVVFVVVGKDRDATVKLYETSDETREKAMVDIKRALGTWQFCKEMGIWGGAVTSDINTI